MTVADIIEAARSWTAISSSSFFTSADELRSVNRAYRDIYDKICDANDDFFVKSVTFLPGDLASHGRNQYSAALPQDFFRLRLITLLQGDDEIILHRRDVHERGHGYRFFGTTEVTDGETTYTAQVLKLWLEQPFDSITIDYYPAPVELDSTTDDIAYPPQLEPLIIAYQMAIDICNINKDDANRFRAEYQRLWEGFATSNKRVDAFNHPRVANVYSARMWGE